MKKEIKENQVNIEKIDDFSKFKKHLTFVFDKIAKGNLSSSEWREDAKGIVCVRKDYIYMCVEQEWKWRGYEGIKKEKMRFKEYYYYSFMIKTRYFFWIFFFLGIRRIFGYLSW